MSAHTDQRGIALLCGANGAVLRVIRDELELPDLFRVGRTLAELVTASAADALVAFLKALADRGAAFNWALPVDSAGVTTPLYFAGVAEGDHFYLVAARSAAGLARFHEELMRINNEQTTALRAALKELSVQRRQEARRDSALYEDLSRLNNELATLQREMAKKNIELEQVNALKNELLGMAAHDLRNPLGVIQNYSDFLEADAGPQLSDEHRAFITAIKRTSRFMLGLVDDLLDVTTIEAGRLTLDRQPSDLGRLLADNVALNRTLAARKHMTIELATTGETLPMVTLDARRIEQVLNNLIGNAIKFAPPGSRVTVSVEATAHAVTMRVTDQGPGIPAADLPNLFKPFAKATARGTAGEKSTGLGLAIVGKVVAAHGGRIWVESEVGKGASFVVALPLA